MPADFSDQLRSAIESATSDCLRANEEMVTKWCAMVEVMDSDGTRSLYSVTPDGLKAWDLLGMLHYGMERSQALAVREEVDGPW